ncbi:hypothetical protein JAAARDRAFT_160758 [Jaapia argillacea MUCL 33604]|uniref:Protein kinase domain-containing protein n=1 Tax=Jaapia argillacea MUCL 33604 TaxID=933084 RepID=A0A067PIE7_9AGAM|nr:hypothetical protein JAAARDRAFT_160758 [Jaapia argillacea MUCL 33604]
MSLSSEGILTDGGGGPIEIAVKKLLRVSRDIDFGKIRARIMREAFAWRRLSHPNILPFIDNNNFPHPTSALISPFMKNGTIVDYSKRFKLMPLSLMQDSARGLEYLHSMGIIHGNFSPSNILVDDAGHARIDMSIRAGQLYPDLPVRWMAPELHDPEAFNLTSYNLTMASDMYGFAMVSYELLSGNPPFSDITADFAIVKRVLAGERPPKSSIIPIGMNCEEVWRVVEECWRVVEKCWVQLPSDRLSAQETLQAFEGIAIATSGSKFGSVAPLPVADDPWSFEGGGIPGLVKAREDFRFHSLGDFDDEYQFGRAIIGNAVATCDHQPTTSCGDQALYGEGAALGSLSLTKKVLDVPATDYPYIRGSVGEISQSPGQIMFSDFSPAGYQDPE